MGLKTTGIAAVAALSLIAAPAVAQDTPPTPTKSPAKLCADKSKKRTAEDKRNGEQSAFAACVSGARKAQAEIRRNAAKPPQARKTQSSPAKLCAGKSRQRTAAEKQAGEKSEFAECVSGAARAQNDAQQS